MIIEINLAKDNALTHQEAYALIDELCPEADALSVGRGDTDEDVIRVVHSDDADASEDVIRDAIRDALAMAWQLKEEVTQERHE